MSWTYCRKCGQGMDEPTIRQALRYEYYCPRCGQPEDPLKDVNEVIIELLERIESLEARNGIHT